MDTTDHYTKVINAYNEVFTCHAGQLVLEDLARSCYLYRSTFVPGDPHVTLVNEGMRQVVLLILDMVKRTQTNPHEENSDERNSRYTDDTPGPDHDTGHPYFAPRVGHS